MGSEIQQIFDTEVVRLAQEVTPVVLALVAAYGLRRWERVKKGLILLAFVYALFLARVYVWPEFKAEVKQRWGQYLRASVNIPVLEKHAGDRYLIARLGREYYGDLIVYNELESRVRTGKANDGKYRLVYSFAPLSRYQSSDLVELVVANGIVEMNGVVPNCAVDASKCRFEVTREEALEVAKRNGVSGDGVSTRMTTYNGQGLVVEVYSCRLNKRVLIDYRDGSVVAVGEAVGCGEG